MQQVASKNDSTLRWWQRGKRRDAERLFLEHLDLINRAATSAARRSGFSPEDIEDFVSVVHSKLIADDYAVVRQHRGTSQLSTYLTTVVHHAFQDWRNQQWGRFRPSTRAKQMGPLAIQLEQLLVRDQLDLDVAIGMLRHRSDLDASEDELHRLAAELPVRLQRVMVSEGTLVDQPASDSQAADRRLEEDRWSDTAERAHRTLGQALGQLEPQERLLLKMHYGDGRNLATVARTLGLDQRGLYTQKDRSLRRLKQAFDSENLTWEEVRDILGWSETPIPSLLNSNMETGDAETIDDFKPKHREDDA